MAGNMNDVVPPVDDYDHLKELQEFDNSKLGVKGLLDAGITRLPRIFHHPPEALFDLERTLSDDDQTLIPVIDMTGPHDEVVQRVQEASAKYGFFQVVNHGIAVDLLDRVVDATKAFHELPSEEKVPYYDRNWPTSEKGVAFFSNHDLFYSKAAAWRDSLHFRPGPPSVDPNDIPNVCRGEVLMWHEEVVQLADRLMGLLSEGLGLTTDRLKGAAYVGRLAITGHYYPYCPEPTKTIGANAHTDYGMLTVLLQDRVGGLQVKYNDDWIEMKPIHGALIINLGDLFQIITNDIYKSGTHRVIANPLEDPRISVGAFFSPGIADSLYGPLPELVSEENPALYKQFKFSEVFARFKTEKSDRKAITAHFRL